MKKLFLLLFILPNILFAQTFIEVPSYMLRDSLLSDTTITRDIWFNTYVDSSKDIYNNGNIDLDIYPRTIGTAEDDTLIIDVYALKLKALFDNRTRKVRENRYTVFAFDSTRITSTLAADTLLHSYALEQFFGSNMPLMDGLRIKQKNQGSSDGDSTIVDMNLKVYHKKVWGRR